MVDHIVFKDIACPRCGCTAGNGGCGDKFFCGSCGWSGSISDDANAVKHLNARWH